MLLALLSPVVVHVVTNAPDVVLVQPVRHHRVRHVCAGSCDAAVEPDRAYVLLGVSGVDGRSPPFVIPAGGDVTLDVRSGSQALSVGGAIATGVGAAGVLTGAALLVAGAGADARSDIASTGGLVAGVAAPLLAWGLYEVLHNRTHVTLERDSMVAWRF